MATCDKAWLCFRKLKFYSLSQSPNDQPCCSACLKETGSIVNYNFYCCISSQNFKQDKSYRYFNNCQFFEFCQFLLNITSQPR